MWGKLLSTLKGKRSEGQASHPPIRRHLSTPSDPFGDDVAEEEGKEEGTPVSSEDPGVRLHHSLEQALEQDSRDRDEDALDAEDDDDNIPLRHHNTLEENIELARELSQELQRQSEELRRSSSTSEHSTPRTDKAT